MVPAVKVNTQVNATMRELENLVKQTPELAEVVAFYRAVLPLLNQYRQRFAPFHLEAQTARSKLEAGLPLLAGEELPFDSRSPIATTARSLFLDLCRIVENESGSGKSSPGNGTGRPDRSLDFFPLWKRAQDEDGRSLRAAAARQIRRAVEQGELDLMAVWEMLTGGDLRRLELTAVGLKLDPELLRVLVQHSLRPAFQRWGEAFGSGTSGLNEVLAPDAPPLPYDRWQRGYCPVCGSSPSLSEIQGKEGARRLRCGLCGAGWGYPNLKCAFCQNENYKLLSYFSVEGEEDRYKLQACNVCQGYIKIVKTFEPIPVDQLLVQDLATLHLDLIAADHGYILGTQG